MGRDAIAADSTLDDVEGSLLDAEKHVANILFTMGECRKVYDNAYVPIGITGEGKAPYHKVVYRDADGAEHLFGSYLGRNRDETYQVHQSTWSTRASSYEEVRNLLGRIRGFQPKTRP